LGGSEDYARKESETVKIKFTVAGIQRDAEISKAINRKYIKFNKNESFRIKRNVSN